MATLSGVSLIISPVSKPNYQVDVGVIINVDPSDVGTSVTIMIELWAVQAPGDFADDKELLPPQPLYTFKWQGSTQKLVPLSSVGSVITTEQRLIPISTLNEDPKTRTIQSPALGTPDQILPRQDEVKARVRMFTGAASQLDSAVIQFGGTTD